MSLVVERGSSALSLAASAKAFLKRSSFVSRVNARWKARRVVQAYRSMCEDYARRSAGQSHEALLASRVAALSQRIPATGRLHVLFIGTDEQQDQSGLLQALEHAARVSLFTRTDGSYGQNDPVAVGRAQRNGQRLREIVSEMEAHDDVPHIVLSQTWANTMAPDALAWLKARYGLLLVNIAMDDRHQYRGERGPDGSSGTFPLIPHLDLTLTSAPECVEWYEKDGCPALFFPMASDPEIFRPMPELPKTHDICFVGGRYGIREKIVQGLRGAGLRVTAFGSGWESGRIESSEVPRLFAQSKVVLGVGTIGHCEDFYSLKLRDFDGPMAGSLYLTHDNPDLYPLFDVGSEILTYRTIPECVEKARAMLDRPDERERIALAGRHRAARDHTWDKRFDELFALLLGRGQS